MGLLDFLKQKATEHDSEPPKPQNRTLKEEEFYLAGVHYYMNNVKRLGKINPDYKKSSNALIEEGKDSIRIFQYNFVNKPVKLVPEPKNPHDKNAIAVHISGKLVGYISRDENRHVLNILKKHEIKFISAFISGGNYKIVFSDGNVENNERRVSIIVKIGYV